MRKEILERFITLRKKAGFSAKELSQKLDLNEYYITKMEKGIFSPPIKELERILALCNSSLGELFYDEFDRYHPEKAMLKKFRSIGAKETSAILTILHLAYDNSGKENVEVV